MAADDTVPMNYYRAFRDIKEAIPRDAIIVSEGANTMDIGRTQLNNAEPRTRLDAGSYGTMGVGFGFAVAAAVVQPDRPVVSVSGDSAFGFSGMELETICRYQLPITTIVLNNGGIGGGFEDWPADQPLPPSSAVAHRSLREGDRGLRWPGLLRRGSRRPAPDARQGDLVGQARRSSTS